MAVTDLPLTLPGKKFDSDQKQHRANIKTLEEFAQKAFAQLVPTGAIFPYGGTVPPANYLLCDGAAYKRLEYKELFAVIGTSYGGGDGATTFNVPNYKSGSATTLRVPVGAGTGAVIGTTTGSILSNAATVQGAGIVSNFIIKS